MTNTYGWPLPLTDHMVEDEMPYALLPEPEQDIAQRLVMLVHLCFNHKVWGGQSGRLDRYWDAFGERLVAATNTRDLATWWDRIMESMVGESIYSNDLLHEKNLLCHPTTLPGNCQVEDEDVLQVLREYSRDLRDRTRIWVKVRRSMKNVTAPEQGDDLDMDAEAQA